MVSASKLRRAQDAIANYLPYQQKLTKVLEDFIASSTDDLSIPLAQQREVKRLAIVAISSNSSLCGGFNSNVIKKTDEVLGRYATLPAKDILVYPIGKKIAESFKKKGYTPQGNFISLAEKPNYDAIGAIADELINLFITKQIDCVELVYNHFKNPAIQQITYEMFLPMIPSATDSQAYYYRLHS